MNQLSGKVAVITGANQGIGKGIATLFAAEGCRLGLAARNAAKLDTVAAGLRTNGADVVAVPTDVSNEPAVEALFDAVMKQFGRVDILLTEAAKYVPDAPEVEVWRQRLAIPVTFTTDPPGVLSDRIASFSRSRKLSSPSFSKISFIFLFSFSSI